MKIDSMTLAQVAGLLADKGLHVETHVEDTKNGPRQWVAQLCTQDGPPVAVSVGRGKNSLTAMIRALEDLD
jgi:hypothetical protein